MEYTETLNLKKPAQEDFYNVDDFNENFQAIDDFAKRRDNPHCVTAEQVGAVPDAHLRDKSNPHEVTAEQVDAVKRSGDIMTGHHLGMFGGYGQLWCGTDTINIYSKDSPEKNSGRYLGIHNNSNTLEDSLVLTELFEDGSYKSYRIFGEHFVGGTTNIATGSYVGTGKYGKNNPNSLVFDFEPKVVYIFTNSYNMKVLEGYSSDFHRFLYGATSFNARTVAYVTNVSGSGNWVEGDIAINYTMSNNTLTWYTTYKDDYTPDSNVNKQKATYAAQSQQNTSGSTYYYVAIG